MPRSKFKFYLKPEVREKILPLKMKTTQYPQSYTN